MNQNIMAEISLLLKRKNDGNILLINSKDFKELNIEKNTTLKANHKEKIKSIAKEISGGLYPERELNFNSLFSKLAQKGYHEEKRR
jgi:hypothetical protein